MSTQKIDRFRSFFRGELIQPTDVAYELARKGFNGTIDKRPRFIVRCVDVGDVRAEVQDRLPTSMTFVNFSEKGRHIC